MLKFFILCTLTSLFSMPLWATDGTDQTCVQMQQYILSNVPMSRVFSTYLSTDPELGQSPKDEQNKYGRAFEEMANTAMAPEDMVTACEKYVRSVGRKFLKALALRPSTLAPISFNIAQGKVTGDKILNGVVAEYKEPRTLKHEIQSSSRINCGETSIDEASCLIPMSMVVIPQGLDQFISYELKKNMKLPVRYSDSDCACLMQEMSKRKNTEKVSEHLNEINKQLERPIIEAVGKKFLNDYASYVEDIGYFATNHANALAEKFGRDYDRGILCQDPKVFEQAIDAACTKNGTLAGKEERLSLLMGSFGDKFNFSQGHFADGFKGLVDDINTYTVDSKKVTGDKPNILTRRAYDEARYGLGRTKPQVDLANDIVTLIAKDKDALKYVEEEIKKGKTPLFGVLSLISGYGDKEKSSDILKKVAKKNPFQSKEIYELMTKLGTAESSIWSSKLFHFALNLNPGLKQIMTSPELFADSVKLVQKSSQRIIKTMVTDRETFTGFHKKRCQGLVANLAEAVCTKKDNIKSSIPSKDLIAILQDKKIITKEPNDYLDLSICMTHNNYVEKGSVYEGIDLESSNPYTKSDYLDRKLHAPEEQSNGLANLAKHSSDPVFAQQISKSTHMFDNERVGIPGFTSVSDTDSRHMTFKKDPQIPSPEAGPSTAAPQMAESENKAPVFQPVHDAASIPAPVMGAKDFSAVATYAPQSVAPAAAPLNEEPKEAPKTAHEKLSRALASSENKSNVSSLINNIDNKDAEEILRLNEQARKDREEITELKLEEERRKTAAMKSELESAQQKLFQLEHPVSGGTTGSVSGQATQADHSVPSFSSNSLSSPGQTSGSAGLGGTPTVTGGSALGQIREVAGGSAALGLRDASADAPEGMSLVINSIKGDGKVRTVEDPNGELINYLTQNEPTAKQLQELKTAGLLYTVENVSKDGVKVQIKKLIRYQELSVEAKAFIERKLASISVAEAKRNYSIQALKLELLSVTSKRSKKI